jgi:hypothetical protein
VCFYASDTEAPVFSALAGALAADMAVLKAALDQLHAAATAAEGAVTVLSNL